jgi:hypothetical protein
MNDDVYAKACDGARRKGVSVSRYVANAVCHVAQADNWPEDYWSLFGAGKGGGLQRPEQPQWDDDLARVQL